jgi:large subunit ribosomal protein L1
MSKAGKKHVKAKEELEATSISSCKSALEFIVKNSHVKFDESVDADIVLGIDATKGEQTVRSSVLLPHGIGKKVKILVFAKGEAAEKAQSAGADYVGAEDLIEKIQGGWLGFDASVATPDMMGVVGKVAKILGPRGLLPNKKIGTVTFDVGTVVGDLKKGRISFRNDKGGIVHMPFGRVSFGEEKLLENLSYLIKALSSCKPATSKGKFIRKVTISSSMGVGIAINSDEVA